MSRESRCVVLVHGSHTVRAVYGVHEIFSRPEIEIPTRVGLRRGLLRQRTSKFSTDGDEDQNNSSLSEPDITDYLVGASLDEALATQSSSQGSDNNDAGDDKDVIEVFYPMRRGVIQNWNGMKAIWRHVLFSLLPIRRSSNTSCILVTLPATALNRDAYGLITKTFFEDFNSQGLCIVETPLVSAYATGFLNACVVDIGWEGSSVTTVIDCAVVNHALTRADVGAKECIAYLAHLLRKDNSIIAALQKLADASHASTDDNPLQADLIALATQLFEEGHLHRLGNHRERAPGTTTENPDSETPQSEKEEENFDVAAALVAGREKAAIEEQERRNRARLDNDTKGADSEDADGNDADADADADSVNNVQSGATDDPDAVITDFRGIRVKVSSEPIRRVSEPLWNPSLLQGLPGADRSPAPSKLLVDARILPPADSSVINEKEDSWYTAASLPDAIARSIKSIEDSDRRAALWEALVVTGAPTQGGKAFYQALPSHLARFVTTAPPVAGGSISGPGGVEETPDSNSTSQPANVRMLKVPDYFAEFKERTDLAPFLGSTIFAKLVFGDPYGRNWITKQAYNQKGPSAAFTVNAP